jgi:formiminotetrahydrofolate cyclodeaminase
LVPLTVMKKSLEVMKLAKTVAEKGNENSISDAGVAGLMSMAAVDGAAYNVRINLTSLSDHEFVAKTKEETNAIRKEAETLARNIRERVESKL